jgi:hypothetical protein
MGSTASDVYLIITASQARQRSRDCAFFVGDPFPAFAAFPALTAFFSFE